MYLFVYYIGKHISSNRADFAFLNLKIAQIEMWEIVPHVTGSMKKAVGHKVQRPFSRKIFGFNTYIR